MHSKLWRWSYLVKDWQIKEDSELNKIVTQWKSNGGRLRKGLLIYCLLLHAVWDRKFCDEGSEQERRKI